MRRSSGRSRQGRAFPLLVRRLWLFFPVLIIVFTGTWLYVIVHYSQASIFITKKAQDRDDYKVEKTPELVFRKSFNHQNHGKGLLYRGTATRTALANARSSHELCLKGVTFRMIFMVSDKDLADLKNLTRQLAMVRYYQCQVDLHLIIKDSPESSLRAHLDQLQWNFGKIYSNSHLNFEDSTDLYIKQWTPSSDKEFALIFSSTSVQMQPFFFDYLLVALRKYFMDSEGSRTFSNLAQLVAGISLEGHRNHEMPIETVQVLSQQSFGRVLLFFPWVWREISKHKMQREKRHESLPSVGDAKSKKHDFYTTLKEFMMINGNVILYPENYSFVNPSAGDTSSLKNLLANFVPLVELPVYDDNGQLKSGLEYLQSTSWNSSRAKTPINSSEPSACILDQFSLPAAQEEDHLSKYLFYEPQGSLLMQKEALLKAAVFSAQLNRTLIIPPLIDSSKPNVYIPVRDVFNFDEDSTKMVNLDSFSLERFNITRSTLFKPWSWQYDATIKLPSPLLEARDIPTGQKIFFPVLFGTDTEMKKMFAGCTDSLLTFRHFSSVIEKFEDPVWAKYYRDLKNSCTISDRLKLLTERLKSSWEQIGCTVFSRGDGVKPCGDDIKKVKGKELKYHQNCVNSALNTCGVVLKAAEGHGIKVKKVYIIPETTIKHSLSQASSAIEFITRSDLVREAMKIEELKDLHNFFDMLIAMVEQIICEEADFFVGNIYSALSDQIISARESQGKKSEMLGHLAGAK